MKENKIKIAVYTAIFGAYDELKIPVYSSLRDEADFFCFTDNEELRCDFYKIIYIKPFYKELVRNSRYLKVMGHELLEQYDYNIWLDATFKLTINSFDTLLKPLIDTEDPIATFIHPLRNCIYKEAVACIEREKDYFFLIYKQILKYFFKGMPNDYGLYETGILVKNVKSPFLRVLSESWFQEINEGSRRDQLSFPFVLWNLNLKIGKIEGCNIENPFASYKRHLINGYKFKRSYSHSIMSIIDRKFTIGRFLSIKSISLLYRLSSTKR